MEKSQKTIIDIGQGKLIKFSRGATEISTIIRDSPEIVAIAGICNKDRFAAISNHQNIKNNIKDIKKFGHQMGESINYKEVNAQILVRGYWDTENMKFIAQDQNKVDQLVESIKNNFGEETLINTVPYSEYIKCNKNSEDPFCQGKISINISPFDGLKPKITADIFTI